MVNRVSEVAALREATTVTPSLTVVIGRRRVGKSFLLARALEGERVVSVQGDEQGESQHLALVAAEAGRALLGTTALSFRTWDEALDFLGEQAARAPLTLVLDEFQWLKASQPALDSIIQRHWDRWDRDGVPLTLVLSGSALTLMEGLLQSGAPLYGRANLRLRVMPLDYREAQAFAASDDPVQLLRRWAVLGGTPQYNLWGGRGSVERVLKAAVLSPGASLYDEPRHLLREGEAIRDPGTYLAILHAIASGATQHNEIAQQSGAATNNLARKLERLEDLGYVMVKTPLEARSGARSRHVYDIADPYFRFWFRYVFRNRSRIEAGRTEPVYDEIVADFDNVMGGAFEACCREWVRRYASEDVTGAPREVGSWWSRKGDVEVDIVGADRQRYVVVGAVKWRRVVDTDVLGDLLAQQAALGPAARQAKRLIFAREGFTDELRRRAAEEGVTLLTAADLYR